MHNSNHKIRGIDQIDIITNGSLEELKNIQNANKIGSILNVDDESICSETTPLIMVINQGAKDWLSRVKILINLGADPNNRINYFGDSLNARDVYYRKCGENAENLF